MDALNLQIFAGWARKFERRGVSVCFPDDSMENEITQAS